MNAKQIHGLLIVMFTLFLSSAHAQTYRVKSVKASVLGSSTLHSWESDITEITCNGHFEIDHNILKAIKNVSVKIPVKGIKSREGNLMDSKTYEAFKYETNPYIAYEADDAEVTINADVAVIKATGNLTMAGITRSIVLEANGKVLPNGDLQVEASKSLKMTDYNMEPPTAILGTIKVGNEVTVKVSLILTLVDYTAQSNSK